MRILMVCLGNICRSPLAQGVMEEIAKNKNFICEIDSAGTSSFHAGEPADPRSVEVAKQNNIDISAQRSRELKKEDLEYFDYIFAMDKSNYQDILKLCTGDQASKVKMFLEFGDNKEVTEVPDPYYTEGFDYVFDLVEKACINICDKIN